MNKTLTLVGEANGPDGYAGPGFKQLFWAAKKTWRAGDVRNPKWPKRDNGFDFITIDEPAHLAHLRRYLSKDDSRLAVRDYNAFITSLDRARYPMIICIDVDDGGDSQKVAIIVVRDASEATTLAAVELVDEFSSVEDAA